MIDDETPEGLIERLKILLDVEEIDRDLYRGARVTEGRGRVFGGQVIAQALAAASRSVDDGRPPHSLHAYFMRPGDDALPIIYRVERDFDGRSFATRRVIALQRGVPILNMAASFQIPETGLMHQTAMPEVPPPEALKPEQEIVRRNADTVPEELLKWMSSPRPIEIRPVVSRWEKTDHILPPAQNIWVRAVAPLGDDPGVHRAVLAYLSDFMLLATSTLPHGVHWSTAAVQTASLDHALWIHEDFRADEWLLYSMDSPWAGHARGFNRGSLFTRDGRLVASVTQEGLIRLRG
ncbi:acyl-CoA thioesterase [Sphingomonas cavernae]|uniref:Acyl-CoA thioesterase 2 n=1 Tax=Sphingomonas cavernae TaxID=2320861 RepID=A0A418WQT1_9SPHN|nr:acyl-CoA thioesterase II [Sphingomonas cavernae]RJF93602.1 acyl-CoA thioesterase II [Sphingomonas cavernae]